MICAYIMAGGSGERFWPLSTPEKPKQLLKLFSDKSMIRETVERILPLIPAERIFIGTNIMQAEGIKEELPMLSQGNIVIEPAFKDTAAAIGYGALYINNRYKDACMIVLASDHLIENADKFRKNLEISAREAIFNNTIVTLGIKPTRPETGYGYIETDKNITYDKIFSVDRFWEKPNRENAEEYMNAGNFLWNSGIFVFKISTILEEIERYMPKHSAILKEINEEIAAGYMNKELAEKTALYFGKFHKISIDFGVMERSTRIKVIPSDFGWNDIGSFVAFRDVFEADDNGNIILNTRVRQIDANDNIIISDDLEVGIVGISNIVLVQTGKKLLICDANRAQDIKRIIS
ncbi:MAG: mannose-1-phosphate guanyltransferase [Firmicutes bacterium HGW-Firmicutes-7]|nr:MAG: mannose-1-phosphate guanyltransferase [Firmicutes bacterium HGW-Firmicutes-7]